MTTEVMTPNYDYKIIKRILTVLGILIILLTIICIIICIFSKIFDNSNTTPTKSSLTSGDFTPSSSNPPDNPSPSVGDHHIDTSGDTTNIYKFNGSTWILIDSLMDTAAIQTQFNILTEESLLQSSYQFRYTEDTGPNDTGFHVLGADPYLSTNSVPLNQGRSSNSHIGYLADSNMRLVKFIVTIRGAAVGNSFTPPTPGIDPLTETVDLKLKLHIWNANNTTAKDFIVKIPLSAVGSYISTNLFYPFALGTNDASQTTPNDINYTTSSFNISLPNINIDVDEGTIFGLEFISTPGNTSLSAIDNTNIKLIFHKI